MKNFRMIAARRVQTRRQVMKAEHYEGLAKADRDYWWFRVRYQVAWKMLSNVADPRGGPWLDVGCGTGGFLAWLVAHPRGPRIVYGIEQSTIGIEVAAARRLTVIHADLADLAFVELPLPPSTISMLDVLEHIERPVAALSGLHGRTVPGAHLVVLVPALQQLWSGWDEALGHYRRYTRQSLCREIAEAGWQVMGSQYLFTALTLPALLRARRGKAAGDKTNFPAVPQFVDDLLEMYFNAEAALGPLLPFGTSVAAVAKY